MASSSRVARGLRAPRAARVRGLRGRTWWLRSSAGEGAGLDGRGRLRRAPRSGRCPRRCGTPPEAPPGRRGGSARHRGRPPGRARRWPDPPPRARHPPGSHGRPLRPCANAAGHTFSTSFRRDRSGRRSPCRPSHLGAGPPFRPSPRPGDRRTSGARVPVLCLAGRSRTMFSKPLAYPSTLDRTSPAAPPGAPVLRGGALEPDARTPCVIAGRNSGRKAARSCNAERGDLSLSGGASILSRSSSSRASPSSRRFRSRLRNDEGDPVGRPRWSCYAARDLAHPPLHEGLDMAEAIAVHGPGRPRRGGQRRRRFGKDRVSKHRHPHVQSSERRWRLAHRPDARK